MKKAVLLGFGVLFALGVGFAQDTGAAPTVDSTVELFDEGIAEVPVDVALANIQGWEATLREANNPDLTAVADNLAQLATALQTEPVDGAAVADLLSQLGEQTRAAAEGAGVEAETASQLTLLASILTQVGEQLSGGETGGAMMGETGGSMMGMGHALAGSNEVPPVDTSASGTVTATLEGTTLSVEGSFEGLSSDLMDVAGTPAHIHQAAAGENGDVIYPLEVQAGEDNRSGTLSGSFELTEEQVAAYEAGNLYVNIHTQDYPGGELRAQLGDMDGMMNGETGGG